MMVRKVFFVLLVGLILTSGLVYAEQSKSATAKPKAISEPVESIKQAMVRDNDARTFEFERKGWTVRSSKAEPPDTIVWFDAGEPTKSWQDAKMAGKNWWRLDHTAEARAFYFHVSDYRACNGDSSWLMADEDMSPRGYGDGYYQTLTSPKVYLDTQGGTYPKHYLVYDHWLRCEEDPGLPFKFSWDGYQVQIKAAVDGLFDGLQ